jgi:single-strand DNA-binding protein
MVAKVTLIGNIGKEPEIKAYGDKRFARFSVAVNRWVKKDKTTMWVSVVVWDQKKVDVIESYASKGLRVYVEGNLEIREYEKDGVKKTATEVVVGAFNGDFQMLDNTKKSETTGKPSNDLDEDMPF